MKSALVFVALAGAGCSPPRHAVTGDAASPGDAADDANTDGQTIVDAPQDAQVDAMVCPNPVDTDGDGVCDAFDRCPGTPDPGQADLDGDQIGWMCDPVESITIPGQQSPPFVQLAMLDDTFAARTKIQCMSGYPPVCGHVLLQVDANGMLLARSDSTAASDAWHAAPTVTWMDGPIITRDHRVLWSRGYQQGDIGDFDLATHVYTSRATGVLNPDDIYTHGAVYAGNKLLALALSQSATALVQNLVEVPAGGAMPTIATAQSFANYVSTDAIALPGTPQRALVPERVNFTTNLMVYTEGQSALASLIVDNAPMTNLGDLQPLLVDGYQRGLCAQRGGTVYALRWDSTGTVSADALPGVTSCLDINATEKAGVRFIMHVVGVPKMVGYVFGGVFHAQQTEQVASLTGDGLPLLIAGPTQVWLLQTDGTMSLVQSGMDSSVASMAGNTIHVYAHHTYPNDPNGSGTWELTRYRMGQMPQTVTLLTNTPNGIFPTLVTTAEGAALVGGNSPDFIVPSRSMTPITHAYGQLTGGIRDGRTVVFSDTVGNQGAVYLYSEDSTGTPQLTLLDGVGSSMSGMLIDTTQSTSWFAYKNGTVGCRIARLTPMNTLDTVPCTDSNIRIVGTRADGVVFFEDGTDMFTLGPTGVARVGKSSGYYDKPIVDTTFSPPVLVGWSGYISSTEYFSCLAMHPERCWSYTASHIYMRKTFASATANAGDGSFQQIIQDDAASGYTKLIIVRSIGLGNVML